MSPETIRRLEWAGFCLFGLVALALGWFSWHVWGNANVGFGGVLALFTAPIALIAAVLSGTCLFSLIVVKKARPTGEMPKWEKELRATQARDRAARTVDGTPPP